MSKSAVKQKRSTGVSRASMQIDHTLRHVGTKQKLFFEEHVCTINRITIPTSESFSQATAMKELEKHHKKRQAHCTARFLEDRISLSSAKVGGKPPFRSWVGYKEISQFFIGKSKKNFFVLCIKSERSKKKYYEIYKCKTAVSVSKIDDFIKRALRDYENIVRDSKYVGEVSVHSLDRVRSLSTFEFVEEHKDEDGAEAINSNTNFRSPSPIVEQLNMEQRACFSPTSDLLSQPAQDVHSSIYSPSPKLDYRIQKVNDCSEITYISSDPIRGPVINDVGPIYMYLSRTNPDICCGLENDEFCLPEGNPNGDN